VPSVGGSLGEGVCRAGAAQSAEGGTGRAQAAIEWGGLKAAGAGLVERAGSAGLRNAVVDELAGGRPDRAGVWGPLPSGARLEDFGASGLELPATGGAGTGAE